MQTCVLKALGLAILLSLWACKAKDQPAALIKKKKQLSVQINSQNALGEIRVYKAIKLTGGLAERCAQAGVIVAAFEEAGDAPRAEEWSEVEERDCHAAQRTPKLR